MKLKCSKCTKLLTTDLRPVKLKYDQDERVKNRKDVWEYRISKYYDEEHDEEIWYEFGDMKAGIFYVTKKEYYNHTPKDSGIDGYYKVIKLKPEMVVSGSSLLGGVIPPNPINCCCNWAWEPLKCGCGNVLGTMKLDCYQDYSVSFDIKKVVRCYK